MNGFFNSAHGFNLQDLIDLQATAEDLYISSSPPEGVVITGLQSGDTSAIATANSTVLNDALNTATPKVMIIPESVGNIDDVWYTRETVYIGADTTVTFVGKIHQLGSAFTSLQLRDHEQVVRSAGPNVVLNNPLISQRGRLVEVGRHGTHACLAFYGALENTNFRINGGILEYGGHNCFQGGMSDTIFDGTLFQNSGEHLIYVAGSRRTLATDPDLRQDGISFLNCTMDKPGNGEQEINIEANHIQMRNFKNVVIDNCVVSGVKQTSLVQYGILATGITNLTVTNTDFTDYTYGIVFSGGTLTDAYKYTSSGFVFTNITGVPHGSNIRFGKAIPQAAPVIVNNLEIFGCYGVRGGGEFKFNDSTFKFNSDYFGLIDSTDALFTDCTWDASDIDMSRNAMYIESGSSATFAGTSTRIESTNGYTTTWTPIPAT